jgi:hypothetical protein
MAENLYHNLRKRMKVIESKVKDLESTKEKILLQAVETTTLLLGRVKALEEHLSSLDRSCEGGNDPRDGGWFD